GPTAELLDRRDILRSVFIQGAGGPAPAAPEPAPAATPKKRGRRAAPLKAGVDAPPRGVREAPGLDAPVILECSGVTKRFGGITAVDEVDLELREGQILGLIG